MGTPPALATTTSYTYNGDGLRMAMKQSDDPERTFVWDQNASLPVVLQDSNGNRYVYGLDLLTRINGATEEWHLYDGLGSTTGLADAGGTSTGSYTYDVFGATRSQSGATTEWAYTGEQSDASGYQYLRARYYDPANGRFVSRDPLPFAQRYTYANNNPVNFIDPLGLAAESCDFGCMWNFGTTAVTAAWNGAEWCIQTEWCRDLGIGLGTAACAAATAGVATPLCIGIGASAVSFGDMLQCFEGDYAQCGDATIDAGLVVGGSVLAGAFRPRANPLAGTTYTNKVIRQMQRDIYHGFPAAVDDLAKYGTVTREAGGDGVVRTVVRLQGNINGKPGFYEWIVEADKTINHRLFLGK